MLYTVLVAVFILLKEMMHSLHMARKIHGTAHFPPSTDVSPLSYQ